MRAIDANPWDDADDYEEIAQTADCVACGGPLVVLGILGPRVHFRCRNCGLDQSSSAHPKHQRADDSPVDSPF
jgi:predicted RNA-binding Zn-ribbon protein involved in translation (DUF1610 family)